MNHKLKTKEELVLLLEILKTEGKKIVTTNGAFDILHKGHVYSLQEAKKYGDVLIVCLNSDQSIKQYKSPNRPIFNQEDRAAVLAALECVDYIIIFNELTPLDILEVIKPNYHVKSSSGYKGLEKEVIEKNGGSVVIIPDLPGYSTTNILSRMKQTD